mgnify:FL=1|jgi:hypothetical protein
MSTQKRSRCKKGTRKNKKTGNCESVLDNTCAICLDRIISGNIKTKCKHNFHKKCLTGWCISQKTLVKPQCPICRSDINDTCKKIMPFDSHEVFRYTSIVAITDKDQILYKVNKIREIVYNPKFDINVKNEDGDSILHIFSQNKWYSNTQYKEFVEYLLKKKNIIVSAESVGKIISTKNDEILALYKKHKKIPKALKNLI